MFALQHSRFQRIFARKLAALASSLLLAAATASAAGCDDEDDDNPGASGSGAGAAAGSGGSGTGGSGTGGSGTGGSGTGGSGGGASAGAGGGGGAGGSDDDGCARGVLEADLSGIDDVPLAGATKLQGPGVDPTTGKLNPGNYVLSATYLRMPRTEGTQDRFLQLAGPVVGLLDQQPGLVASSLSSSTACATARTLTVWESVDAMMAFVGSPEHTTAMAGATEVSRGGSAAMHWEGTEADATWQKGAEELAKDPGLGY